MHTRRGFITSCTLALIVASLTTGAMAKSCLWKVTSKTGSLYVQGSIHILKADNYPLPPAIEQAYAASEALVFEVDMKEMSSPGMQQRIMSKAMLPSTKTLQQTLTPDTYEKLSAACMQIGLPIATLGKFKPWFATMTLSLLKLQQMGFAPQHGLDTYFYNKARGDGKHIIGMESIDFQIDLFDQLAGTNPNDFVLRALTDLDVIEKDVYSLERAWISGDIDAVGALVSKSFEGYPKFHKTFVLDRNARWLTTLNTLIKKPKTHMVVVGAGHLPGKGGLLELLQNKGYTLEQL